MASLEQWLALWRLPGVGPAWFQRAIEAKIDLESLFNQRSFSAQADRYLPARALKTGFDWKGVERDLIWAEAPDQHILRWTYPGYPTALSHIARPSPLLFVRGSIVALEGKLLAMVGSRQATSEGRRLALSFSQEISQKGFGIVSGLARGIDAASHQGALAAQAVTVAVLGHGLDTLYPREHGALAESIVAHGGALVSEFPIGTAPHPSHFPRRNRVISGLSMGVLVVEATLKSGSLITARYALDQGREIFALPGSLHSPLTKGCHALIRDGAILVETTAHILEELR